MKYGGHMNTQEKLDKLEKELQDLKAIVLASTKSKKIISLRGDLKGLRVNEKDVKKSKKSLFTRR